jgi:hypothetical protein
MRKPRKTAAPITTGNESIDDYIRRLVKAEMAELEKRVDELQDDLDEIDVVDQVNEAMQNFTIEADAIDGLEEAIEQVIDGATITLS